MMALLSCWRRDWPLSQCNCTGRNMWLDRLVLRIFLPLRFISGFFSIFLTCFHAVFYKCIIVYMHTILSSPDCMHIDRFYCTLNCRQTSILTQLCTGHTLINKHLHKIQKNDLPNCPHATCNGMTEGVHHLLFTCPHYTHKRYLLTQKIGKKALSSATLLADKDTIPHTFEYLNKTGRFRHIYGDITPDQEG
jgi:hypothetical protein